MRQGYVKLYRKSIDSQVFQSPELWKLWCLCLMKANHKKEYVLIEGISKPVEILPGQFITGRFELHRDYYPKKKKNQKSPLTLWRWLQILENMQNLNISSYSKYSIITITNWAVYQEHEVSDEHQNEQQMNNRRTTDEQQMNTNKNDKECKERKRKREGRFSPPSVEEVRAYCDERENGIDPEAFVDFYSSKNWMVGKNKMKDWKASVRTWERRNGNVEKKIDGSKELWWDKVLREAEEEEKKNGK